MPAVTNPRHRAFPENGNIYRLFWGGEILLPEAGALTPRTRIWLKEVDDEGFDLADSPVVEVSESAGAIPRLAIDTYWRNGKLTRPKYFAPAPARVFEIEAPEQWSVVRARDIRPRSQMDPPDGRVLQWIDQMDLELSFLTSHGRRVHGGDAWVVPAATTAGEELILPSYEIFRSLLANTTTNLCLALLRSKWDTVRHEFVEAAEVRNVPAGLSCQLDLASRVPESAVLGLALLSLFSDGRRAANAVYPQLVQQGSMPLLAWIPAFPPVAGRLFRIKARVLPLRSRNAFLVTQILGFDPGVTFAEIAYSVPTPAPVTDEPTAGGEDDTTRPRRVYKSFAGDVDVTKPADRRPGGRPLELPSLSMKWTGLPAPKRLTRRIDVASAPEPRPEIPIVPPSAVSVGVPGNRRSPAAGTFTPQEERDIEDRFQDIRDLVDWLVSEGKIESVANYPLVRPVPAEFPEYCEFPTRLDGKSHRWSIVRKPTRRARLAMVLEIKLAARTIYWIETESLSRHDQHHSLAVETIRGDPLDEGMLSALLDTCASEKGVWPEKLGFGDGTILYERARHNYQHGRLVPSTILYPFARLASQRRQLRDQTVAAVTEGSAAHLE